MLMTARECALQTLISCENRACRAEEVLWSNLERAGLSRKDSALATRICYGVLQNKILLDFYIAAFSRRTLNNIQTPCLCILRMGCYQLLMMDRIPPHAAVNESAELAKKYAGGRGAAGFVNAILRKVESNKNHLPEIPAGDTVEYLSIRYSHPHALVDLYIQEYGREVAEKILKADNEVVPLTVQVNLLKTDTDSLMRRMKESYIDVYPHPWMRDCLQINGSGALKQIPGFNEGLFYVQDAAARCAVEAAGLIRGDSVIDICAAPGGKTFAAAIKMENQGTIVSCDIHSSRVKKIEDGARRLGLTCIRAEERDGSKNVEEYNRNFRTVLCDVPCSSFGVIRKKPDIRYRNLKEIERLPEIQLNLLENASLYVKEGGALIYSTCTLLKRENEDIVRHFCAKHPDFRTEEFSVAGACFRSHNGCLKFFPFQEGCDGFFIAKLRRK